MLPAPFYSELPTELGDDRAWLDQAGAPAPDSPPRDGTWRTAAGQALALAALVLGERLWGYSSWS